MSENTPEANWTNRFQDIAVMNKLYKNIVCVFGYGTGLISCNKRKTVRHIPFSPRKMVFFREYPRPAYRISTVCLPFLHTCDPVRRSMNAIVKRVILVTCVSDARPISYIKIEFCLNSFDNLD